MGYRTQAWLQVGGVGISVLARQTGAHAQLLESHLFTTILRWYVQGSTLVVEMRNGTSLRYGCEDPATAEAISERMSNPPTAGCRNEAQALAHRPGSEVTVALAESGGLGIRLGFRHERAVGEREPEVLALREETRLQCVSYTCRAPHAHAQPL